MKKLMKTALGVWCMVLGAGAALAADLPFDPFVPPAPQRSDPTKYGDGTEPIMFFLQHFMAGDSRFKFDEYNDRIRNDDEDYEAYICRGLTWLTSLSEDKDVMILVNKFGFMVNDEYGTINFSPISYFDFGSGLQYNRDIDAAWEKAVPVLKAALADFEKVPKNWSGSVDFQEGFDVPVSFDYADSLVARSVVSEMLSFLYLMKGYNTVAADGTARGCVPGFYYTLYGAAGVRALPMTGTAYGSVLCGADRDVEFFGVVKPSDAAGFFTIGVLEIPTFYVAGEDSSPTGIPPYLPGHPPVRH